MFSLGMIGLDKNLCVENELAFLHLSLDQKTELLN